MRAMDDNVLVHVGDKVVRPDVILAVLDEVNKLIDAEDIYERKEFTRRKSVKKTN
jgi:hypothetical protein